MSWPLPPPPPDRHGGVWPVRLLVFLLQLALVPGLDRFPVWSDPKPTGLDLHAEHGLLGLDHRALVPTDPSPAAGSRAAGLPRNHVNDTRPSLPSCRVFRRRTRLTVACRKLFERTRNETTVYLGPWEIIGSDPRRVVWQCSYEGEVLEHFCMRTPSTLCRSYLFLC